jgi:DNA-binding transcriptional regulator YdaS (Cro superfamily)
MSLNWDRPMQLRDYLRLEKEKAESFSVRVGVTVFAVRKWVRGERVPRPATIMKIKKATKGKVTAEDWMSNSLAA